MSIEQQQPTVDQVLDGVGSKVVVGSELVEGTLGIKEDELFALCGAPRGSQLSLEKVNDWTGRLEDPDELVPAGLHIIVRSPDVIAMQNEFVVFVEKDSDEVERAWLYLKLIDFAPKPELKGIGSALVRRIASAARALGFWGLRMEAAGGRLWEPRRGNERWAGYHVWPKAGFDMKLTDTEGKVEIWGKIVGHFPHVPRNLSGCRTVQAVFDLEQGPEWWKLCGDGSYMEFMLQEPANASWVRLFGKSKEVSPVKKIADDEFLEQQAKFARTATPHSVPRVRRLQGLPVTRAPDAATRDASIAAARKNPLRRGTELPQVLWED